MDDRNQRELPFAEAEGSRAERRNLLGLAMLKIGVDAYESRLLELVFNITDGGKRGALKKSYEELSARPWNMCCSLSKVRTSVRRMKRRSVLAVEENIYVSDGQAPNSYTIDWQGIRRVLGLVPSQTNDRVSLQDTPLSLQDTPLSLQDTPLSLQDTPYKEDTLFVPFITLLGRPAGEGEVSKTGEHQVGRWSDDDRQHVVAALRSAGYDLQTATRLARESETEFERPNGTSLLAADVVAICDEFSHPLNRPRFERAGAIGYRLRNGTWPVDGVVPLHVARGQQTRRDDSRKVRESETELFKVVKSCREAKVPDDEIRRRLRERLPAAVCAAAGW